MKSSHLLLALLLSLSTSFVSAAPEPSASDKSAPAATPDAGWLAHAQADYPLKTCVVSDEDFGGEMGEPIDYVYQQAGKPDRLIRFCCKKCRPTFEKDPAKYLRLIDDAAAAAKAQKG